MSTWSWCPGPAFGAPEGIDPSKIWNRKLWGAEMMFAQASLATPGREDILLSCTIDVPDGIAFDHQHVRAAMRSLRFTHPSIASKVAWPHGPPNPAEAKFEYASPASEEHIHAWLDIVVQIINNNSDVEAALSTLRLALSRLDAPRTDDLLKLYHVLPSSQKPYTHGILLYARHALFDGIAIWEVLDCYLQELAQVSGKASDALVTPLDWGTENVRLARAVADRTERKFAPTDLHSEWPTVKRLREILSKPSTSFGIPVLHLEAPMIGTDYLSTEFSEKVTAGLLEASRKHGPKMYSMQFASVLVACLRITPISHYAGEQRVTLLNPVNLRSRLSKNGASEIVSSLGFDSLEVDDLLKYYPMKDDKETTAAVWAIAKDIQEQMISQRPWKDDVSKVSPILMKTLAESMFANPPLMLPLRIFGFTNLGVMDHVVKHEYIIANSQFSLRVAKTFFHCVLLHFNQSLLPVRLYAFTRDNKLQYSWSYSPTHMGEEGGKNEEGPATLAKFITELEKVTILLSQDV